MYNHTAILTKDLNSSRLFYERLGLSVLREWKKPNEQLSAVVIQHPDGMILELIHHPGDDYLNLPVLPELFHIGFAVENVTETLKVLGNPPIVKPLTQGVSVKEFIFILDPSGFPVELVVEKK